MSRRKEIDIEEFKRLYASGLSYTKIAQKLNCSVSVVNNYRITLKLPPRERVYECKEIDEALFRKLYISGATYREIGDEFGITPNSVMNFRLKLGFLIETSR